MFTAVSVDFQANAKVVMKLTVISFSKNTYFTPRLLDDKMTGLDKGWHWK